MEFDDIKMATLFKEISQNVDQMGRTIILDGKLSEMELKLLNINYKAVDNNKKYTNKYPIKEMKIPCG